jgi:hypothetical protein
MKINVLQADMGQTQSDSQQSWEADMGSIGCSSMAIRFMVE